MQLNNAQNELYQLDWPDETGFSECVNSNKLKIDNIINDSNDYNLELKKTLSINNWVLKIKYNELYNKISANYLEKFLLQSIEEVDRFWIWKIKSIDFSDFNNNEYQFLKEKMYNIIWKNFPLLKVSRLEEWLKVLNISFFWIKKLNDNVSKEFVDLFTWKVKEFFHSNFLKYNKWIDYHWRVIRNTYKHMTFSFDSDSDISEMIFDWENDKIKILENIFESISNFELGIVLKKSKINTKDQIKKLLFENFDFWIWTSLVEYKWENNLEKSFSDKLISLYEAEISSRNPIDLNKIWYNLDFNFDNIKSLSKDILNMESEIINKFEWKKFIYNKIYYDIVVDNRINNVLIKYIRKGIDIWNTELFNIIKLYIDKLNNWFDFIAPYIDNSDFHNVASIDNQLREWIINVDLLFKNYKKSLSLNSLKIKSKWNKWLRIFIDIVDMWIMNLIDFKKLAWKINSWEITLGNISELLDSWITWTSKIQNLVNNLKLNYNDAKISLWWDELFIFFPGKTEQESINILSSITYLIKTEGLVWRLSSSFDNSLSIFDSLDHNTSINKFFEEKIETIINTDINEKIVNTDEFYLTLWKLKFSSINLKVDKNIQKIVSWNISEIIKVIDTELDLNEFKNMLSWKTNSYKLPLKIQKIINNIYILWNKYNFLLTIERWKNSWISSNKELIISIK